MYYIPDLVPHWPLVSFVCEGSGLDDQHFSEIIGITLTKEQNRWGATKRALASVYTKGIVHILYHNIMKFYICLPLHMFLNI